MFMTKVPIFNQNKEVSHFAWTQIVPPAFIVKRKCLVVCHKLNVISIFLPASEILTESSQRGNLPSRKLKDTI